MKAGTPIKDMGVRLRTDGAARTAAAAQVANCQTTTNSARAMPGVRYVMGMAMLAVRLANAHQLCKTPDRQHTHGPG